MSAGRGLVTAQAMLLVGVCLLVQPFQYIRRAERQSFPLVDALYKLFENCCSYYTRKMLQAMNYDAMVKKYP